MEISQDEVVSGLEAAALWVWRNLDSSELTVRKIRTRAEEELGFAEGFFLKETWRQMSKKIIKDAVVSSFSSDGEDT